jgi:hypothetical protein
VGALTPTACRQNSHYKDKHGSKKKPMGEEKVLTWLASRSIANDHRLSSLFYTALGFIACHA